MLVVSVLTRLRQGYWCWVWDQLGLQRERPLFRNNKGQGRLRNRTGEKAVPEEETVANSVEMTKCEARTHTKILCIFVYYFVCMPCVLCVCGGGVMAHVSQHACVGQRTTLWNQILSFHVYVGSSNWSQVSRLVRQMLLPSEPSCKPFNALTL